MSSNWKYLECDELILNMHAPAIQRYSEAALQKVTIAIYP